MRTMVQTSFAEAGSPSRWARAANERWGSGGSRLRVGRRASRCARAHVPVVVAGPGRRRGCRARPWPGSIVRAPGGGGERATDGGAESGGCRGDLRPSPSCWMRSGTFRGEVRCSPRGSSSWSFVFLGIGIFLAPALANSLHLDLAGTGSPATRRTFCSSTRPASSPRAWPDLVGDQALCPAAARPVPIQPGQALRP